MIKVLVNGSKGKMGTQTIDAIKKETDLVLAAKTDAGDDLANVIQKTKPDVVVDFTHAAIVKENCWRILKEDCKSVIGTTGLSESDLIEINDFALAKKKGMLVVPNFAIGAILMMQFAAKAAKYMPKAEIIELHHDQKLDAPSGTAINTAKKIAAAYPEINKEKIQEKELITGVRGGTKNNIPIHSIRLEGYVASQEVIFGGLGQTLKIRHDTISRESFMPGVVLAIKKVMEIDKFVYGLENVMEE